MNHLTFAGGAGTVTGSKHLVETAAGRLLLDCGLFQGLKALRLRNWARPPFDPREVDAVALSHAHIDHAGALPLLVKQGFRGPVHCTPATADLLGIVLRDSAHIHEEDARRANRYGYTKHHPALPLYDVADAEATLELLVPHPYGTRFAAFDRAGAPTVTFQRAGHILGSALTLVDLPGARPQLLAFSGDLGRSGRPILRDPDLIAQADILLLESTYGDRKHAANSDEQLVKVINETAHRGGAVIVPAFAIGRTQELLWTLRRLEDDGRLPLVSVHVDSPMARSVTDLYVRHPEEHDLDMTRLTETGDSPLTSRRVHFTRSVDESKAINERQGPMIIIAGSGMATAGRVLHHLERRLPDHRNTVLLVGFQPAGTRGRALQDGAPTVRIHGTDVPVRAQVATIDGLSAHADRDEIVTWLRGFERPPRRTYLVHGEPEPAQALAATIEAELGWPVSIARDGERVRLD